MLATCIDNLIFNYDSVIPRFFISTRNKDTGEHYYNTLTKPIGKVPAQISLVSTDGKVIVKDLDYDNATIKVRGNSTASGAKKPYNIKFSKKQNLFTFGKSKKWVLLADYYDPTLMRNKIALDLGKKLGLEATPDNKHVEVYVDGEYRGVYLLTEKIEADKNRVNIETESGDFLVEMDSPLRVETGNVYLTASSGKFFRMREPDLEDETDAEKIASTVESVKSKLDDFENILKNGNWDEVKEIIDVDEFVSFYVLNEFMKTIDLAGFSAYFYCKDGKIYAGPAWDHDLSSGNGNSGYGSIPNADGLYTNICNYYAYLTKIPEFNFEVFKKFKALLTSTPVIFEEIYKDNDGWIDSDISLYKNAIERNNTTWNVGSVKPLQRIPEPTYEGNINYLKSWLKARHEWLANYFLNRIYKDPQDGNYYYYKNGEKTQAGIIELDNNYYYAGEGGKISTGEFELDGNLYKADETGKFLAQDLSVELFSDNNNLTLDEGKAGLIKFNLNVAANYGGALIKNLTSGYAAVYTLENAPENILINNNGLLSVNNQAQAGEYEVKVTASVTLDGVTQSESINFKIIINKVQEPAPEPTPAPAASEPKPVQIITPEPVLIQEIAKYNPASWGDETAQQVALIEAALDLEQAATQGMNAQVSETNIEAVKNSGLVMGLQEVIAFGSNAQPDTKLDSIASSIAQTLAANAAIFTGSQSAENLLKVETTFGDLRAFLFEAQNNINDGSQLAASAAPFKAAQAGVYFIKLDLGDTSGLIGKRLNYFATPFSSNNSQVKAKAQTLKFKSASENNNLN